jgi:hypothetical protein
MATELSVQECYIILGLEKTADRKTIENTYRAQARALHRDVVGPAEETQLLGDLRAKHLAKYAFSPLSPKREQRSDLENAEFARRELELAEQQSKILGTTEAKAQIERAVKEAEAKLKEINGAYSVLSKIGLDKVVKAMNSQEVSNVSTSDSTTFSGRQRPFSPAEQLEPVDYDKAAAFLLRMWKITPARAAFDFGIPHEPNLGDALDFLKQNRSNHEIQILSFGGRNVSTCIAKRNGTLVACDFISGPRGEERPLEQALEARKNQIHNYQKQSKILSAVETVVPLVMEELNLAKVTMFNKRALEPAINRTRDICRTASASKASFKSILDITSKDVTALIDSLKPFIQFVIVLGSSSKVFASHLEDVHTLITACPLQTLNNKQIDADIEKIMAAKPKVRQH